MDILRNKYKISFIRTTEDFYGRNNDGGIWLSGEDDDTMPNGVRIFNYYSENYKLYDIGVHVKFQKMLENNGWFAEWYDAGTIMLYPD